MLKFRTQKERRLWILVAVTVAIIYSTLGFAGTLAAELRDREMVESMWIAGLVVLSVVTLGVGISRPGRMFDAWVIVGVLVVFAMILPRAGVGAEERTHLFEYGLVGVLVFHALNERFSGRKSAGFVVVAAILSTAVLGLIDELLQFAIPNRGFEFVDVAFNALAGAAAVVTVTAISAMRKRLARD